MSRRYPDAMPTTEKVPVYDRPAPGAVKCEAPGCPNWFVKQGNRHRYCKAPNCTYRKGMPAPQQQRPIEGAAQELLLRLNDESEGEVGPEMLVQRRKAVQVALRQSDREALVGALVDEAACCVWWADRVRGGEMPAVQLASNGPAQRPVGLAQAVIASHRRTFELSEHRIRLLWGLIEARERLASAEHGVEQTAGSEREADARTVLDAKRVEYDAAERAFEAGEAAWRERAVTLRDLTAAAA